MMISTGYPLLMESSGPVEYKRESVATQQLHGKLLDLALACSVPFVEDAKVTFGMSGHIEEVKVLSEDGTYKDWSPSIDEKLALELLEMRSSDTVLNKEELLQALRQIVFDNEGDTFYFDRPVKQSRK